MASSSSTSSKTPQPTLVDYPPLGEGAGARKKRECPQNPSEATKDEILLRDKIVDSQKQRGSEEQVKKIRAAAPKTDDDALTENFTNALPVSFINKVIPNTRRVETDPTSKLRNRKDDDGKGWDLETALHHVVGTPSTEMEFISYDKSKWITFRVGHGGDASTIASLYRGATEVDHEVIQSNKTDSDELNSEASDKDSNGSNHSKSTEDGDALELRLASGLGDEDTPPTIFAVMVEIKQEYPEERLDSEDIASAGTTTTVNKTTPSITSQPVIAAVALLTLDWKYNQRILCVEWMYVDNTEREHDLIQRRLWFRLSALALVTKCQLLPVEDQAEPSQAQTSP
jgi:hypothetical protein